KIAAEPGNLLLDWSGAKQIDSSIAQILVALRGALAAGGRSVEATTAPADVGAWLGTAGLQDVFRRAEPCEASEPAGWQAEASVTEVCGRFQAIAERSRKAVAHGADLLGSGEANASATVERSIETSRTAIADLLDQVERAGTHFGGGHRPDGADRR